MGECEASAGAVASRLARGATDRLIDGAAVMAPRGPSLYDGLAGVAVALRALGRDADAERASDRIWERFDAGFANHAGP